MKASPQLILASGSARRLELLRQIGFEPHKIITTDIDETPLNNEKPAELARRCASLSGRAGHRNTVPWFLLWHATAFDFFDLIHLAG